MSTEVAAVIFDKVKVLPPEQQNGVLEFIEKLGKPSVAPAQSIWEEIREIVEDVPDEIWEQAPRDGSLNVDHYLYGAPKK